MSPKRDRFYKIEPIFNRRCGLFCSDHSTLFEKPGVYRRGNIDIGMGRYQGLPTFPEPPPLAYKKSEGPPPNDIETLGPWWLVSDAFKVFAESSDADAFEFAACNNSYLESVI